ncbi:hypothetical protein AAV35_005785 [Salimicrobium jeotgali]|uniref:Cyclic nucleotide-binding domain-containing protein n=1 Tax=Salimicrobium jeotgali TaxID=1230341 RepID=K2H564_9BACI|nr:DUF294 nucleotidyltransferase-like domain-containing protein [Salimicrobium jeotgali]AKG04343.1 hypothetical protein AAV35_005785 [Salimicrobium jeotgali]EKE31010.1 hypothetical protein MJ3_10461 [Salimicrobium jeotgali]MBM7697448.1 CBS domain-containing protein [Salimicrobium jeotgali]
MEVNIDVWRHQYPFELLDEEEFSELFRESTREEYSKNEFVIHEDQSETDVHILIEGLADSIMHRADGTQHSIRYFYPGDLIGLMVLLTSEKMRFSVRCLEPVQTLKLKRASFLKIMKDNPTFSNVILDRLSGLTKSLYDEVKYKSSDEEEENENGLFKERIKKYMEKPVFIQPSCTIAEAAQVLREEEVEGLLVSENRQNFKGMISYHEIVEAFMNGESYSSVSKYMKDENFSVGEQDFIFDALSFLKHHPATVIPVMHKDQVAGILRQSSFIQINQSVYFDLTYRISNAKTLEELVKLSPVYNKRFQEFVRSLIDDQMLAYHIAELITNYNDRIHKQIIQLAEDEMVSLGYGAPPINYCFLIMGSGGRKEQTFSTDQDNGIILADYESSRNKEKIEAYFSRFTKRINDMLDECGFPYCSGGIMAKERKWRKNEQEWRTSVDEWIKKLDAEEIRDFTVFMDFRPVFGDYTLAYELKKYVSNKVKNSLGLHQLLMKDTLRFRVPVQPFGRINGFGKKRLLDLKKSATMQIVNAVRIYSMKYGVEVNNTVQRLTLLAEENHFHPRDVENAKLSLHRLMLFRLTLNLEQLKNGSPLSNYVSLVKFQKQERRSLKEALNVAKRLQQVLELSYNRNRVM